MHDASPANRTERPTDGTSVNWRAANRRVRNLRRRIFRATQEGDWEKVQSLQRLMLRSYANTARYNGSCENGPCGRDTTRCSVVSAIRCCGH